MIIEEKKLYDFLDDANQHELHFSRGRQNCLLIKSAFDVETDFLYLLEGYYENDPHKAGDSAAYAGVYSHVRREYFDIPYALRDRADENKSIEEVLTEFSRAVSARIAAMVHDAPVPVTEEAEEIRDEREYYQKYALPREARECFFGDAKRLHYQANYYVSDPSTAEIAAILNHFEDAVNASAKDFIRKKARAINERLWETGLLREEVARMEATPGEYHARRAIMRSIAGQNMKTVNLEIQKGDESTIIKIEALALRCMDDSYYSPWRMDAPSRYKLVERFGRNTEVYPDDVVKITYGRKVLYERNAVVSKS
mgnify:CR=1 FL=1